MNPEQNEQRKFRRFLIQDILDLNSSPAERWVRKLDSELEFNKKFLMLKTKTKFQIVAIPNDDPEQHLAGLFQYCIDETISEAEKKKIKTDRLGAIISSPLLNPDIWIPLRPVTENTLNTILNRFLLVSQSKTSEGSLFGEPFSVVITVTSKESLPEMLQVSGRGYLHKARKLTPIRHVITRDWIFRFLPGIQDL